MAILQQIQISDVVLEEFCLRWKIAKLELVGVFPPPSSDITLLVTFATNAQWGLLEHVRMERELSERTGHSVKLVSRRAIEESRNPLWKNAILGSVSSRPIFP